MSSHITSENSDRIRNILRALRLAGKEGLTSRQIQVATGSCAPAADASDLRKLGYAVHCAYEGKSNKGKKVYRYRLFEGEEEPAP